MFRSHGRRLTMERARERRLMAHVREIVDRGEVEVGLIDALASECRSRLLAEPRDSSWHLMLGRFLMAAGDPRDALSSLEQALRLEHRSVRTLAHIGIWYETALAAGLHRTCNITLPDLGEIGLCADVLRFSAQDHGPLVVLRDRAATHLKEALRANLSATERHVLESHLYDVSRSLPSNVTQPGSPVRRESVERVALPQSVMSRRS